jgi:hypothetical protein
LPNKASTARGASSPDRWPRYEVKPDGTVVVVIGKPESAEPENAWSLDEFRTKETKQ